MNKISDERLPGGEIPEQATPDTRGAAFAFGNSTLSIEDGIWRMKVRESGFHETGFAIGRLLAAADYPAVRFFDSWYARLIIGIMYAATRRNFRFIRIPERYLQELRGYAEGSGLPYSTLFFMNFVFDILKRYGFHCSSVAFAGEGPTMVGRNTDLIPWIARAALKLLPPVVLDVVIPGTLRYVHVTPGFFLGVFNGFNWRGIAMMSHQIAATKEKPVDGNLATPLLQRMILEEATGLDHAEQVIRANPIQRCISNLVTSSEEGSSAMHEITPMGVKTTRANGPFMCCATHFEDAEFADLQRHKTTVSEGRLKLMNALAAKARPMFNDIVAILRNADNGLTHKKSGYSPTNEGTYQSIVFDVTGRRLFVSNGREIPVSLTGEYREIVLDES